MENGVFKTLYGLDVSAKTEKKDGLTYLSWPYAWAEAKKAFPGITYEIWRDPETRLPYVFDANTGYMVSTSVTLGGITHEMWLPVMDAANHAMKAEPYEIQTKYKTIPVKPATMFDINKTIMRCLVKNLAMFGLGLYIYAGEDLPEDTETAEKPPKSNAGARNVSETTNPSQKEEKPADARKRTNTATASQMGLSADPNAPITDEHWNYLVDLCIRKYGPEDAAKRFKELTGICRKQDVRDVEYASLMKRIEEAA